MTDSTRERDAITILLVLERKNATNPNRSLYPSGGALAQRHR